MDIDKPLILVVEDNLGQQKVIQALAEALNFGTIMVSSGQEALDALATCDGCFEVILMDWKLPDMDGLECTRRIRDYQGKHHTPVIAVTGHALLADREKCLAAGMDDYLSKPFTADDFRRMLLKWSYNAKRPNLRLLPGPKDATGKAP